MNILKKCFSVFIVLSVLCLFSIGNAQIGNDPGIGRDAPNNWWNYLRLIPQTGAPSTLHNGMMWSTSAGIYARINGVTVGPFTYSGGTGSFSSLAITGLTGGYIPYIAPTTKILTNSPITTDGTNVGIGTASPAGKLDIYGTSNPEFFVRDDGGASFVVQPVGNSYVNVGTYSNHRLSLVQNNTEYMSIISGGNVGIGTTTPNEKFSVSKSAVNDVAVAGVLQNPGVSTTDNTQSVRLRFAPNANYVAAPIVQPYIESILEAVTGDKSGFAFGTYNGSALAERIRISNNGNLGIGATSFGTSAAKVLGIGLGTAPSTSPADMAQMWVADQGGVAGKASVHMRDEAGSSGPVAFANLIVETDSSTSTIGVDKMYGQRHVVSGAYTLSLPTAAIGYNACFMSSTAAVFSIDVITGTDVLVLGQTALAAGNKITSDGSAYAEICVESKIAGIYNAYPVQGVYIDGGA